MIWSKSNFEIQFIVFIYSNLFFSFKFAEVLIIIIIIKKILELLKDSLNEYAYDADIAGLSYSLSDSFYGVMVGQCFYLTMIVLELEIFLKLNSHFTF